MNRMKRDYCSKGYHPHWKFTVCVWGEKPPYPPFEPAPHKILCRCCGAELPINGLPSGKPPGKREEHLFRIACIRDNRYYLKRFGRAKAERLRLLREL